MFQIIIKNFKCGLSKKHMFQKNIKNFKCGLSFKKSKIAVATGNISKPQNYCWLFLLVSKTESITKEIAL